MVLGAEEELNCVTDVSADVARAVYQLTAWANLDRMSGGSTSASGGSTSVSGGRTRSGVSGVGRLR